MNKYQRAASKIAKNDIEFFGYSPTEYKSLKNKYLNGFRKNKWSFKEVIDLKSFCYSSLKVFREKVLKEVREEEKNGNWM